MFSYENVSLDRDYFSLEELSSTKIFVFVFIDDVVMMTEPYLETIAHRGVQSPKRQVKGQGSLRRHHAGYWFSRIVRETRPFLWSKEFLGLRRSGGPRNAFLLRVGSIYNVKVIEFV